MSPSSMALDVKTLDNTMWISYTYEIEMTIVGQQSLFAVYYILC